MIFCVMNDESERREGLKALLRQVNRQATAIDARDWRQAQRVVERTPPDLLLIDWQSRWMKASDLKLFLRKHPKMAAAILADDAQSAAVAAFLQAGALGVVPRDLAPRLIVRAFELVLLGGHYVPATALDPTLGATARYCPRRAEHLAAALTRRPHLDEVPPLSPRQHQIMRLVHLGNTNKVIARALGISEGTVKIHLSSVFRALGATNRAAAVAIYNGWQFRELKALNRPVQAVAEPAQNDSTALPSELPPELPAQLPVAAIETVAPVHQTDTSPHWLVAAEPPLVYRTRTRKQNPAAAHGETPDAEHEPD